MVWTRIESIIWFLFTVNPVSIVAEPYILWIPVVCDGQTSPHRPRLVVSRSTCPPLFPPHPREHLCIGTAVINTHGTAVTNTLTHTAFYMGLKSKVGLLAAQA